MSFSRTLSFGVSPCLDTQLFSGDHLNKVQPTARQNANGALRVPALGTTAPARRRLNYSPAIGDVRVLISFIIHR